MTTKYLSGAYPAGYSLSAAYTGLVIESSAAVGGSGVSANFDTTIQNYGQVDGVSLFAGGTVTNGSGADPTATISGVYVGGASATIANYGTINGVELVVGGTVNNGSPSDTAALIGKFGIFADHASATVANYGTIEGAFFSVELDSGGTVTNGSASDTTALIGSYVECWASTIVNFGTIESRVSSSQVGVFLNGGVVTNGAPGDTAALIKGRIGIDCYGASAAIVNFGTIQGLGDPYSGVVLYAGGTVTNGSKPVSSALIEGNVGVTLEGPAMLTNFGTISGSGGDAVVFKSPDETLQIEPGSHLVGAIYGFSSGDTIDLAGAPVTGATWANNVLTLTNGGVIAQEISLAGNFQQSTFNILSDGNGGSNIVLGPTDAALAQIASDAYSNPDTLVGKTTGGFTYAGFDNICYINDPLTEKTFFSDFYIDPATKQIIVAFRGTNLDNVANDVADVSFLTGNPTTTFLTDLSESAAFLASIEQQYSGYGFTLTGHSLGGAIAQILGAYTNLPTVGFDALGGATLFTKSAVQAALAPLNGITFANRGANIDISMAGDQVSFAGTSFGNAFTVPSYISGFDPNVPIQCLRYVVQNHSSSELASQLAGNFPLTPGQPYANVLPLLVAGAVAVSALSPWAGPVAVATVAGLTVVSPNVICAIDPGAANEYTLTAKTGSPSFAMLVLPQLDGVSQFEVSQLVNGKWSAATGVAPGGTYTFAAGARGLRFSGEDGGGNAIALPVTSGFFFGVSFTTAGTFNGSLTETLGTANWVGGSGDWSTGANWSTGASPGAGDDGIIKKTGPFTLTISAPIEETLINLQSFGATVVDTAAINLDSTLTLGAGKFVLAGGGVVSGGTLTATHGSFIWSGGTLDNVTYEGTLNLSAKGAAVSIDQQLIATDATGTGTGTIVLTGAASQLSFIDIQTIDNATIQIGSASAASPSTIYSADPQSHGAVLTLGSHIVIQQTGRYAAIGGSATMAGDGIVNHGAINAGVSGGRFTISPLNFTNVGAITVSNGDHLLLQPSVLTNLTGTALSGGVFEVDAGSTLELNKNVSIVTNDATIVLSGAGSKIESLNSGTGIETQIDATLIDIGATGTLELLAGRNWSSTVNLSNAGALSLGGGTLRSAGLTNSGNLTGFGVVASTIDNTGTITATGGGLDLTKPISGTGALVIAAAAALEVDGSATTNLSLTFNGTNAVLALKAPAAFAATISGLAVTDAIDLLGKTATSATLGAGDKLVITDNGATVATLQLSGAYSGDVFTAISDGHGGTDVMISAGGAPSPPSSQRFVDAMAGFGVRSIGEGFHFSGARAVYEPMLAHPRVMVA